MRLKIYKLKKDVNSPNFTRTIEAGRIYTLSQLKNAFNINETHSAFKDWFEDVSDDYEMRGCMIIRKSDKETIRSTVYLTEPSSIRQK